VNGASTIPNLAYEFRIKCGTTQFDVEKQLQLTSRKDASGKDLDGATFNVKYRCDREGTYDAAKKLYLPNIAPVEGMITVGRNRDDVVKDLKVGAECKVCGGDESTLPQTKCIKFDKATVASTNARDQMTGSINVDAKSKPVLTVAIESPRMVPVMLLLLV